MYVQVDYKEAQRWYAKVKDMSVLYAKAVLTNIRLRHTVIRMQAVESMVSHAPRHYLGRTMRLLPSRRSKHDMALKDELKTLLLRDGRR